MKYRIVTTGCSEYPYTIEYRSFFFEIKWLCFRVEVWKPLMFKNPANQPESWRCKTVQEAKDVIYSKPENFEILPAGRVIEEIEY